MTKAYSEVFPEVWCTPRVSVLISRVH